MGGAWPRPGHRIAAALDRDPTQNQEGILMAAAYKKNSITLPGAVAMGTGVMIGAGIFALTGQIAELAGPLFPLSFVVGAIVTAFSAYRSEEHTSELQSL